MARAYFSSCRHLANVDVMSVEYRIDPPLDDAALNDLFARAWSDHVPRQFASVLAHSLGVVCAFDSTRLVGFVNLATDGGEHAFLLDPTVDPHHRRRGIGTELVRRAADLARERGCKWLHVDYEAALTAFYHAAGFRDSAAGVMRLDNRL
jgi:GNAT superfamily N-acetyltransferase